ncbi:MAG: hypothetical protein J6W15_07530 [Clostridia bacterium]|nr:hypothetical protein [Clostridia bacterium]MBO7215930.1 hypothetical protein [Clostridia bacterium]MBO7245335.1 hypothetical protein [Clostridia bacterium]MBO7737463.1 hypothetical protein [Clostridia bacterium]
MKNKKQVFGIAFVAQALTCLVLSIILWNKNKVLARTFAVVSALGGVAGTYFLLSDRVQKKLASCFSDAEDFEDDFEDFDVCEDDILCTFEGEEDMEPMPAL